MTGPLTASSDPSAHPLSSGHIFESPGDHLAYRVIGPCCRLYDREQLPWPCCRIQWHSKEPSWRRIGRRFIVDLATRKHPSYAVEIVGQSYRSEPIVMTLYTVILSAQQQSWWHSKQRPAIATQNALHPPIDPAHIPAADKANALQTIDLDNHSIDPPPKHLPTHVHTDRPARRIEAPALT